jgi:integrase
MLGAVLNGDDPAKELKAKRAEHTLKSLIDLYAEIGTSHLKERTRQFTLSRLRNHAIPLLGSRKVTEITVRDIERMIRDVAEGKTAKTINAGSKRQSIFRGGPGAAAKAARDLSAVFTFAIRDGLLTVNPCLTARKPKDGTRDRFLRLNEVVRLGTALEEVERAGANKMGTDIIRLLLFTGCRRDEISGLKWQEVDFEYGCLRLDESKTGKSVRPLGAPALAILSAQFRHAGSEFVFPSLVGARAGHSHYQGTKRIWTRVRQLAGLEDVVLHTFRHTMGSASVSAGESLAMTGAILGHKNSRSTDIYAHVADDPAKRAADRVTETLSNALLGNGPAEVVRLPKRRAPD